MRATTERIELKQLLSRPVRSNEEEEQEEAPDRPLRTTPKSVAERFGNGRSGRSGCHKAAPWKRSIGGGGEEARQRREPGKTGSRQGGHGAIPQQKGHGGETGLLICFSGQRRGWRQRHKDDDDDGGGEGK